MPSGKRQRKKPKLNGWDLLCEDNWTWDRNDRSHEVVLSGKNFRTATFHPHWSSGTAAIRGTRMLNNGRYYWELSLSKRIFGTSLMFGIATKKAQIHEDSFINLLGIDEHSWGLSHKGFIWHKGRSAVYTRPFQENMSARVGIFFDGQAGTLTFYKNGKSLGAAFRGLNQIGEPLYPIICSTAAKTEMTLENMRRDFLTLQDRCRAVIVKRLRKSHDVEKLCLPLKIQSFITEIMDNEVEEIDENIEYLETHFLTLMPNEN